MCLAFWADVYSIVDARSLSSVTAYQCSAFACTSMEGDNAVNQSKDRSGTSVDGAAQRPDSSNRRQHHTREPVTSRVHDHTDKQRHNLRERFIKTVRMCTVRAGLPSCTLLNVSHVPRDTLACLVRRETSSALCIGSAQTFSPCFQPTINTWS